MRDISVSEWTVLDTFKNGDKRPGKNIIYKKYDHYGYTIYLSFNKTPYGEAIITYVRKWIRPNK